MRQILPAITIVILLCLAIQTIVNDARVNADNEARAGRWRVSVSNAGIIQAARTAAPTSRPATQPVALEEAKHDAK